MMTTDAQEAFEWECGFKVNPGDFSKALQVEIDEAPTEMEQALERLIYWCREGPNYGFDMRNPKDMLSFVMSHRLSCVWAVVSGKINEDGKEG